MGENMFDGKQLKRLVGLILYFVTRYIELNFLQRWEERYYENMQTIVRRLPNRD